MRKLVLSIAAVAAALAAFAPAASANPFTIGSGQHPHLLVDPSSGALNAVWVDNPLAQTVHYCRLPRGATACQITRDLPLGIDAQTADQPFLVRDPGTGTLYVAMTRYVGGNSVVWRSTDAGSSWSGPTVVHAAQTGTTHAEPIWGPLASSISFADWNPGRSVFSAPADGSAPASTAEGEPAEGGVSFLVYDFQIAPTGDGGLIAAAHTLAQVGFWRMAPGGDPGSTAAWSAPSVVGPGHDSRLAAGPSGSFLFYEVGGGGVPTQMQLLKWNGTGFGPPVKIGAQEAASFPDLFVGPSGTVVAAWQKQAEDIQRAAFSTDGGASFSAPITFATDSRPTPDLNVSIAQDNAGFAVWQGLDNKIRAAPIAPGGSGATTGTTTQVPGGSVTFSVPKACVPVGGTYRVTLTWKRKKRKGNLFVKVRRADFYVRGKVVKRDEKAPFVQTLKVAAGTQPGITIPLRARAFIKVHKGRSPKKSIRATIKVCAA